MRQNRQQGFVLAVVLWSIAALTMITAGIIARINATLEQSYRMRELAQLEQDMFATEQTLIYLISALPLNAAGLSLDPGSEQAPEDPFAAVREGDQGPTLRFDNSEYPGIGKVRFTLQDPGAMFSLLTPKQEAWSRLMSLMEVERSLADRWLDQINDYQDQDSLTRLNGAEAERYRDLGLPDPPNRFMISVQELRNLPVAHEHPQMTERLIRLSSITGGGSANLNTSPAEVLRLFHQLSLAEASRVVVERRGVVLNSLAEASSRFGVLFRGGPFGSAWSPGNSVRLALADAEGRQRRWITVTFTPNRDGQPWLVESNHPVDLNHRQQEPHTAYASSPDNQTEAASPAIRWAPYQTFFPARLPLER